MKQGKLKSLFCKHGECNFFEGKVSYGNYTFEVMYCSECGTILFMRDGDKSGRKIEFVKNSEIDKLIK